MGMIESSTNRLLVIRFLSDSVGFGATREEDFLVKVVLLAYGLSGRSITVTERLCRGEDSLECLK